MTPENGDVLGTCPQWVEKTSSKGKVKPQVRTTTSVPRGAREGGGWGHVPKMSPLCKIDTGGTESLPMLARLEASRLHRYLREARAAEARAAAALDAADARLVRCRGCGDWLYLDHLTPARCRVCRTPTARLWKLRGAA